MAETKNIMIVGVGGQGTLLTSRILGGITVENGYDVKLSEVHGMAPVSYTHLMWSLFYTKHRIQAGVLKSTIM